MLVIAHPGCFFLFYLLCACHLRREIPTVFFRQCYVYAPTTMAEYINATMSNSGEQNG
jgi:hypothetical protein